MDSYNLKSIDLFITCSPILFKIYVERLHVDVMSKVKIYISTSNNVHKLQAYKRPP